MTTATIPTTPAVGEPVLFEGLPQRIVAVVNDKVEFASELKHDRGEFRPNAVTGKPERTPDEERYVPRFRTVANLTDLLWSSRLNSWYVWGRVLSKGRGAKDRAGLKTSDGKPDLTGQVGVDQRQIAAALRDVGIIPSRETRRPGQVPAAGEQHGLFCDLFADGSVDWTQELRNLRTGEGLSTAARGNCAKHKQGFCSKRLNHGYVDRNDGDPGFDAVLEAVKKGAI